MDGIMREETYFTAIERGAIDDRSFLQALR